MGRLSTGLSMKLTQPFDARNLKVPGGLGLAFSLGTDLLNLKASYAKTPEAKGMLPSVGMPRGRRGRKA
jgi:hypothetical protein